MKRKRSWLPVLVVAVYAGPLAANDVHTPAFFLKMLTDSKLTYQVTSEQKVTPPPPPEPIVLTHGLHWEKDADGANRLVSYDAVWADNEVYKKNFQEAEGFFRENPTEAYRLSLDNLAILANYVMKLRAEK